MSALPPGLSLEPWPYPEWGCFLQLKAPRLLQSQKVNSLNAENQGESRERIRKEQISNGGTITPLRATCANEAKRSSHLCTPSPPCVADVMIIPILQVKKQVHRSWRTNQARAGI